ARYFSRMGVLPDNPNEVYFLAQSLYLSVDGGATTRLVPENFPDHHDIWFDPLNPNRILLANDRYVNISTTRGRGWFHVSLPNAQINRVAVDRRIPYNVDRKSTRLNSSHVEISYAVFCLKKKKE